jgi:hypothetical protein
MGAPELFGIPLDFVIFATILLGVALFHHSTLAVALTGLAILVAYKLVFTGFSPASRFSSRTSSFSRDSKRGRDLPASENTCCTNG